MPTPSVSDRTRLRLGEQALALPWPPGPEAGASELKALRDQLARGVRAMQSLDNLGSREANERAWQDLLVLESRLAEADRRLAEVRKTVRIQEAR